MRKPAFTGVKLRNGWAPYGAGTRPVKVAKDVLGNVYLRGTIKRTSGTSYEPFQLAKAYRPKVPVYLTIASGSSGSAQLLIDTTGQATILFEPTVAAPEIRTSFEGVVFRR